MLTYFLLQTEQVRLDRNEPFPTNANMTEPLSMIVHFCVRRKDWRPDPNRGSVKFCPGISWYVGKRVWCKVDVQADEDHLVEGQKMLKNIETKVNSCPQGDLQDDSERLGSKDNSTLRSCWSSFGSCFGTAPGSSADASTDHVSM
jgi:hypothetical protein